MLKLDEAKLNALTECSCSVQSGRLRLDNNHDILAELVCDNPACGKVYSRPEQTSQARKQSQFHNVGKS